MMWNFLKVGHHGSRYSTCQEFLDDKIKPELAVIPCSESNTYGHPSPETNSRLSRERNSDRMYDEKRSGTVYTDGHSMRMKTLL